MKKFISNQLGPNFTVKTAWRAFLNIRFLFSKPYSSSFLKGKEVKCDFPRNFQTKNYLLFNAARTALGEIAKIVKTKKKVGIPAVCCAVMATPFLAEGLEIEWLDCDEKGLLDLENFAEKADRIGIVLVPHTFGLQVDMQKISKISREKNIFVIEDGAHSFAPISKYADAKILSFGREKDVSCVSGGALLWHDDSQYAENFAGISLPPASKIWTLKHLFQPLVLAISLRWWFYGGRFFAGIWSKLKLFPRAVTSSEKCGAEDFPRNFLPRAIQEVLKQSLSRRESDLAHRQKIAEKWQSVLPKLFPKAQIIVPENFFRVILTNVDRAKIKKRAKSLGFDLNEWDGEPISPLGVNPAKFSYKTGDCPQAEKFMKNYITLPTNVRVSVKDVERFAKKFRGTF